MSKIENTVFISYRRTNIFTARAVYQYLKYNGYDVFMDYESIDSGAFDHIILNQIKARAHFLVILSGSALERCSNPEDWLRREIETAIEYKRNIIPLTFEDFDWKTAMPLVEAAGLKPLARYNSVRVPGDYFEEAMHRLTVRFLNIPLESVIHPTPAADKTEVERKIAVVDATPKVTADLITAEQYFEKGNEYFNKKDYANALSNYSEAIRLNPVSPYPYLNRGVAQANTGQIDYAILDFDRAVSLKTDYADAYINRGYARRKKGDVSGALEDYNQAIRLNPDMTLAYRNRSILFYHTGDYVAAIQDSDEMLRINPEDNVAYNDRGEVLFAKGDYASALKDFKKSLDLEPDNPAALAGIALTQYAMNNKTIAFKLWKTLTKLDQNIMDADWISKRLNWALPLTTHARKLIAELKALEK